MAAGTPDLVARMQRAAQFDVTLYEEVEADEGATGQAGLVVILVGIAGGLGNGMAQLIQGHGVAPLLVGAIGGGVGGVIGWAIWALLTYCIGTYVFHGTATLGEMMRTLGFAQSMGVLNILGFIPLLGGLVRFVVGVWMLVAGVIAVRQAMEFSTGKAILTVIVGWLVPFVLMLVFGAFIATLVAMIFGAAAIGGAAAG